MSLSPTLSLDDVGAVYITTLDPDTSKTPASKTAPSAQQQTRATSADGQQNQTSQSNLANGPLPSSFFHDTTPQTQNANSLNFNSKNPQNSKSKSLHPESQTDGPLAPPLPQRNTLRRSRRSQQLIDGRALGLHASAPTATTVVVMSAAVNKAALADSLPTPHDMYLSSEEDASSLDDLSDFDDMDNDPVGDDHEDLENLENLENQEDTDDCAAYELAVARKHQQQKHGRLSTTSSHYVSCDSFAAPESSDSSIMPRSSSESSTAAVSASSASSFSASPAKQHQSQQQNQQHRRRHSHDTARVVSVVFSGKPSLIDLASEREARRRSSTETAPQVHSSAVSAMSASSVEAPSTHSAPSIDSAYSTPDEMPPRPSTSTTRSTLEDVQEDAPDVEDSQDTLQVQETSRTTTPAESLTEEPSTAARVTTSSSASLASPASASSASLASPASPASPASFASSPSFLSSDPVPVSARASAALFRGVSRTLTISRRYSRPSLQEGAPADKPSQSQTLKRTASAFSHSMSARLPRPSKLPSIPPPAKSPTTYNDIVRSARRKSVALTAATSAAGFPSVVLEEQSEQDMDDIVSTPLSATASLTASAPVSPAAETLGGDAQTPNHYKRPSASFLGSFTGRRRSIKASR